LDDGDDGEVRHAAEGRKSAPPAGAGTARAVRSSGDIAGAHAAASRPYDAVARGDDDLLALGTKAEFATRPKTQRRRASAVRRGGRRSTLGVRQTGEQRP